MDNLGSHRGKVVRQLGKSCRHDGFLSHVTHFFFDLGFLLSKIAFQLFFGRRAVLFGFALLIIGLL
jgi:hypothetical protein